MRGVKRTKDQMNGVGGVRANRLLHLIGTEEKQSSSGAASDRIKMGRAP